ncbi:hypothetical protein A3E89_00940 [Candidatus Campbellbacteria bacterium RIFCSPHIGHO2_12_FULL_35_10]|uniref:Uncharacterized protein n=1 Tax=Candidatus Campbellbacteria bacterium RIFCSPHIGHO2_12_FULL_35_10 TaxID=1797578 RepID=A0A1F5EPJ0_9BACT|nr:MAG: hypothetical protein A3E89_00940 [Candidatus Campbellbacteria bacterium RIFCSPHIGHO2_12_FULL_35_10]
MVSHEHRKISFEEFLAIMEEAYMSTTFAKKEEFEKSIVHMEEIFKERVKVSGEMTLGFANLCAEIHTKLDPGL